MCPLFADAAVTRHHRSGFYLFAQALAAVRRCRPTSARPRRLSHGRLQRVLPARPLSSPPPLSPGVAPVRGAGGSFLSSLTLLLLPPPPPPFPPLSFPRLPDTLPPSPLPASRAASRRVRRRRPCAASLATSTAGWGSPAAPSSTSFSMVRAGAEWGTAARAVAWGGGRGLEGARGGAAGCVRREPGLGGGGVRGAEGCVPAPTAACGSSLRARARRSAGDGGGWLAWGRPQTANSLCDASLEAWACCVRAWSALSFLGVLAPLFFSSRVCPFLC